MTLKALGPDAATPGTAARDSAAAAGAGAAAHAQAAHTRTPGGTGNRASAPGGQQAPAAAAGAAGTEAAPPAQAAHTRTPGGTGNRASAPGEQRTPADAVGSTAARAGATARPQAEAGTAAPDATMTLRAVRPDGAAPGGPASDDDRTSVLPTPSPPAPHSPTPTISASSTTPRAPPRGVRRGARPAPRDRRTPGPRQPAQARRAHRRVRCRRGRTGRGGLGERAVLVRDAVAGHGRAGRRQGERAGRVVPGALGGAVLRGPVSLRRRVRVGVTDRERVRVAVTLGVGLRAECVRDRVHGRRALGDPVARRGGVVRTRRGAGTVRVADTAPVLRRGDRGPEVVELQQRLRQVWLYQGDADGRYSHRVEEAVRRYQWQWGINEELGVYGPRTRARLESETRTP
ncbi:peptidoglycan-binding protein [Streptomyces thermocarboxydus]